MQHLGAPERAEHRDVGFSPVISALTFIKKMFWDLIVVYY
jgi:hypothetical protein